MKARPKRSAPAKTTRRKPVEKRTDKRTSVRAKAAPVAVAVAVAEAEAAAPEPVAEEVVPAAEAPVSADAFFLTLAADCTLRDAADLQFSLMVANGNPLLVDGSEVQRMDTAGAQLLVALALRQRNASRRMQWKAASPELLNCSRRLGLLDVLGLAALAAGDAP